MMEDEGAILITRITATEEAHRVPARPHTASVPLCDAAAIPRKPRRTRTQAHEIPKVVLGLLLPPCWSGHIGTTQGAC